MTHQELARQLSRQCQDVHIDVALEAVSETLARIILTAGCRPEDALAIVTRFTRRLCVRVGEPDPDEAELEDLHRGA